MIRIRVTAETKTEEAEEIVEMLKERFEILKVSKPVKQRNDKYYMTYIDVEKK